MTKIKEKILNRVPARAWTPDEKHKGTSNLFQAGWHFLTKPDDYVQQTLDIAHKHLQDPNLPYEERQGYEGYLTHRDGLAVYLGMPQNSDSFLPAEYTPTKGKFVNNKGMYIRYMRQRPFQEQVMEAYNDPYNQKTLNAGENVSLVSPYSRAYSLSKGRDSKGEYAAIYDEWDYHPSDNQIEDFGTGRQKKDWISKIIGGTPFSVYDRIYLDDFYKVPDEYRGTSYLPEIVVTGTDMSKTTKLSPEFERQRLKRRINFGVDIPGIPPGFKHGGSLNYFDYFK